MSTRQEFRRLCNGKQYSNISESELRHCALKIPEHSHVLDLER